MNPLLKLPLRNLLRRKILNKEPIVGFKDCTIENPIEVTPTEPCELVGNSDVNGVFNFTSGNGTLLMDIDTSWQGSTDKSVNTIDIATARSCQFVPDTDSCQGRDILRCNYCGVHLGNPCNKEAAHKSLVTAYYHNNLNKEDLVKVKQLIKDGVEPHSLPPIPLVIDDPRYLKSTAQEFHNEDY